MDILSAIEKRRSIRLYTGETIPEESLAKILQVGLLAPSSRNLRPWQFIVVRDKEALAKMAKCRPVGPQMLAGADAAIVVLGNTDDSDVWVEDCSIALTLMHLTADSLGVGSCWIQGRLRPSPDGRMAEDYLRDILGFPENYSLLAILSLGMPAQHPEPKLAANVEMEKVHCEKW